MSCIVSNWKRVFSLSSIVFSSSPCFELHGTIGDGGGGGGCAVQVHRNIKMHIDTQRNAQNKQTKTNKMENDREKENGNMVQEAGGEERDGRTNLGFLCLIIIQKHHREPPTQSRHSRYMLMH